MVPGRPRDRRPRPPRSRAAASRSGPLAPSSVPAPLLPGRMLALAWSLAAAVLSTLLASGQAFLAVGPSPGHAPATLATYAGSSTERNSAAAAAATGLAPAALLGPEQEEGEEEENASSNEDDDQGDYGAMAPSGPGRRNDEQTVYVIEFETEADGKDEGHRSRSGKDMADDGGDGQSPLDPWSIVWYIGSFGGLVAFFLIVSCSEWCCRQGARPLAAPYTQRGEVMGAHQPATESPPPPYHLFAPPPYDSVNYAEIADKSPGQGEKLDIYVITLPIHPQQQQQQQQQQEQPEHHPPA